MDLLCDFGFASTRLEAIDHPCQTGEERKLQALGC
jgi:hypothetical protein